MARAREKFCPKCGEDITDSYDEYTEEYRAKNPEMNIRGDWFCDGCAEVVEDLDEES